MKHKILFSLLLVMVSLLPGWSQITTMHATLSGIGIKSLNGLTAKTQTFGTGTTGTDFNISSSGSVHTFNIPYADSGVTGLVTDSTQFFSGNKTFLCNSGPFATPLKLYQPVSGTTAGAGFDIYNPDGILGSFSAIKVAKGSETYISAMDSTGASNTVLTIKGHGKDAVFSNHVTVNHFISTGSSPTIANGSLTDFGSSTIAGHDAAGTIGWYVGASPSTSQGAICTVTFAKPYDVPPYVVICAINSVTAQNIYRIYVDNTTTTGFSISKIGGVFSNTNSFLINYIVIQ